ncbi:MAG: DEAD/DEAH box helicase [Desulfosalsimonadaceae bacterium]
MSDECLNLAVMPDGKILPEWTPAETDMRPEDQAFQETLFEMIQSDKEGFLFVLGFSDRPMDFSPSLEYFRSFAGLFVQKLSRIPDLEDLRHQALIEISEDELDRFLARAPWMTGAEYITGDRLREVWGRICDVYAVRIRAYPGTVSAFIASFNPSVHLAGRVYFHLVENKHHEMPFAFMATYSTGMGLGGKARHLPLSHALKEYGDDRDALLNLLSTVYRAAEKSDLAAHLIETGELFHPLGWSAKEALRFLREIPVYEEQGVLCRIPDWWKAKGPGVSLALSFGDKIPSRVGMDALLDFNAAILVGDMLLSVDEARELLEESRGLAFLKNKWVAVDPEKLQKALEAYDRAGRLMAGGVSFQEAIRMQLAPEKWLDMDGVDVDVSVSNGTWLASVMEKFRDPLKVPDMAPGKGFTADLREYQKKGLNWLCFLNGLNFGACLADDMGLGKTVQILAFLSRRKKGEAPVLLVLPASLVSNWVSEIHRFLPKLKYMIAHPGYQQPDKLPTSINPQGMEDEKPVPDGVDLVITTYSLVRKYAWLAAQEWETVILDEAQAIKNPGTRQTQSVKQLKARNRIIMSGTPIENRVADLWSLFDFLNPGLLGSRKEFTDFAKNLNTHPEGYARLRKIVSPYILRRLKTDKTVISDLPDKVEMKTYAGLSKKQAVLYQHLVQELEKKLVDSDAEGIARKGLVLSAILKFKQLCNHPDQFTGNGGFDEKDSGKFIRLREICETIYEKRERALVFTQFREIIGPLEAFLETIFGRKGLVLHGGVPVNKRKALIEKFQDDAYCPFMVLSLKAGGVGLNLTKASHVIHFDRWWNPAVENQATDRAFRIGQKKNVMVHAFITEGTIEEKIDRMLEDKKSLSDKLVEASGETLITEMGNEELMTLFRLTI